jgi:hypothetical protein
VHSGRALSHRAQRQQLPRGRTLSQRSLPLGSAIGWQFNFETELQLGYFFGSPSSPTGNVTPITPDGSGYDFVLEASASWEPRAVRRVRNFVLAVQEKCQLTVTCKELETAAGEAVLTVTTHEPSEQIES